MAVFGWDSIGSSNDIASNPTLSNLCKYTLTEAGDISKLSLYLRNTGAEANFYGVIYDATGAGGTPGALKGTTPATACSTSEGQWVDATFSSAVVASAGDYWIGWGAASWGGILGFYNWNEGTAGTVDAGSNPATGYSAAGWKMSVYGTYTASGSPTFVGLTVRHTVV